MGKWTDPEGCCVYIFTVVKPFFGVIPPVKVGIASNPYWRIKRVQYESGEDLRVYWDVLLPTRAIAYAIEQRFHAANWKCCIRREWFNLWPLDAKGMLLEHIDYIAKGGGFGYRSMKAILDLTEQERLAMDWSEAA